jgi:hypothetical protein
MFHQHTKQQKYTSYDIKPYHVHVLLIYIHSECLRLYIINKNYQWILTFGLLDYLLPSKLMFFFIHVCYTIFFKFIFQIYPRLFFTFARITCYLEYIWFTHNIFCILQHDWRCNMDYSPLWSAFKMKTKNIRITSIQIYEI